MKVSETGFIKRDCHRAKSVCCPSSVLPYDSPTSAAELTVHEKCKIFPLELKLAPGGIFGISNVNSSSSSLSSVASKVNVNVCPKVAVIEGTFC